MIALLNHFSRTGLVLPCILGLHVCLALTHTHTHTHTQHQHHSNPFFLFRRSPQDVPPSCLPWPLQPIMFLSTQSINSLYDSLDNKRKQFCVLSVKVKRQLRQVDSIISSVSSLRPASPEYRSMQSVAKLRVTRLPSNTTSQKLLAKGELLSLGSKLRKIIY